MFDEKYQWLIGINMSHGKCQWLIGINTSCRNIYFDHDISQLNFCITPYNYFRSSLLNMLLPLLCDLLSTDIYINIFKLIYKETIENFKKFSLIVVFLLGCHFFVNRRRSYTTNEMKNNNKKVVRCFYLSIFVIGVFKKFINPP